MKKTEKEEIVTFGHEALRSRCKAVVNFDKMLHEKIDIIAHTLACHGGGAALAAPQIALLKRITVINYMGQYFELINPVITETSGEVLDFEGCLSMPGFSGRVVRYRKIKAVYQDRFGEQREVEVQDEMARCFQHEIDHLDGILYIDRVKDKFIINPETDEVIPVQPLVEFTKRLKKD